jgi:acetyltransferase-like isoleucine patch superfamily enzyme
MRRTTRYRVEGANSLWHVYKTVPFWKVVKNFVVIQAARYTPFLGMKNWLYRTFLRMKVGDQTSFALMVMLDVMFPEKISVGRNTVIGYNTTILAHEYLIREYRLGDVEIGSEVMIGANSTIMPGIKRKNSHNAGRMMKFTEHKAKRITDIRFAFLCYGNPIFGCGRYILFCKFK